MQWNASLYDQKHDFVSKYGTSLLELLHPAAGENILDVGCGTGDLAHEIFLSGATVTGIDASREMIDEARRKFPQITFECTDAALYKKESYFDAAFSNAVIHWVKDQDGLISRIYHNLKPGGRFVAEFGAKGNVYAIIDAVRKELKQRGYGDYPPSGVWFFPTLGEYTSRLEAHGFTVRFAEVFDRPTELKDANNGIMQWLEMFGAGLLKEVKAGEKEDILYRVQENLRDKLVSDGRWYADYKRLRFRAVKEIK